MIRFIPGGIADVNKDLLGRLMVARYEDTEEGDTDEELRTQVLSLLIAGHEVLILAVHSNATLHSFVVEHVNHLKLTIVSD